jgi:hypothetical protein
MEHPVEVEKQSLVRYGQGSLIKVRRNGSVIRLRISLALQFFIAPLT